MTEKNISILDTVLNFLKENKLYTAEVAVLSLVSPLVEVLLPFYYGKIIDELSKFKEIKWTGDLTKNIKLVVALWIGAQCGNFIMDKMDAKYIPLLQSYITEKIVKDIIEAFEQNTEDPETSKMIHLISKIPFIVSDLVHELRTYILPAIYVFMFSIGYFFYIDKTLGLIALLGILSFFIIIICYKKELSDKILDYNKAENKIGKEVGDILDNISNIFSLNTKDKELNFIKELNSKVHEKHHETFNILSKIRLLFDGIYLFIFTGINSVSFSLFKDHKIDLSTLSTIFIIVLYNVNQLGNISAEIPTIVHHLGMISMIQSYLDKLKNKTTGSQINKGERIENFTIGEIVFNNVNYMRGSKVIFSNLNLFIPSKLKTAIIGKIGSGKTTIINLIMKYCVPQSGNILIDNKEYTSDFIRKNVSYVRQNPKLFNRTIYENIVYGLSNIKKEDVKMILQKFGLEEIFGKHTIDSKVGRNGCKLSGGQKQIILFLRLYLKNEASILILDEPTSALNEELKNKILNIIMEISKNKTTIVITHDNTILNLFDNVINLDAI